MRAQFFLFSLLTVMPAQAQLKSDFPLVVWDKVPAQGKVLYVVERALDGNQQAWTAAGLTDLNAFMDTQTLPGLNYTYRVRAQLASDAASLSLPSNEPSYLMPSKLPAPRVLVKGAANASELRNVFYRSAGSAVDVPFEWDESYAPRIAGFYVYRATGLGARKSKIATLAPDARMLSYVMPGGSTAEYRLELVAVTKDALTGAVKEYGAASEQVIARRMKP